MSVVLHIQNTAARTGFLITKETPHLTAPSFVKGTKQHGSMKKKTASTVV